MRLALSVDDACIVIRRAVTKPVSVFVKCQLETKTVTSKRPRLPSRNRKPKRKSSIGNETRIVKRCSLSVSKKVERRFR